MADRIQVLRPLLPDAQRLLSYLRRIDASRTYANWGPLVCELEARLAAHLGLAPGSVTTASSGTTALVGAILATVGRASSERPLALVPAFTFVATALAVEQCGFRPHLVDINAETWQAQPDALRQHPLLAGVGLVVPVAPFGRAVPQAPWLEFHRRTEVPVVIDGGASFEHVSADPGRGLGEIPVALSFHATKSFSTAEGGCVITSNEATSTRISRALNFGFYDSRDCRAASTNGKMSEYHAAVGLAELDGWPAKQEALLRVAEVYRREVRTNGLGDRIVVCPDVASCYVLFRCASPAEAARLTHRLETTGIETRHWYGQGLHHQPYYTSVSQDDDLSVAAAMASRLVGLPLAPDLSGGALRRIVTAIAESLDGR